jgi:hypothetical protein
MGPLDAGSALGGFYRLGRASTPQGQAQQALKLWQLGQIVAQDSGNLASVAVMHARSPVSSFMSDVSSGHGLQTSERLS